MNPGWNFEKLWVLKKIWKIELIHFFSLALQQLFPRGECDKIAMKYDLGLVFFPWVSTFYALSYDTKIVVIVVARLSWNRSPLWLVLDFYFCAQNLSLLTQKNTMCQKRFFSEISRKIPIRANYFVCYKRSVAKSKNSLVHDFWRTTTLRCRILSWIFSGFHCGA